MRVDWLSLHDFRSYHQLDWAPDPGVNVLLGRNGAGKTNLLEAVGYLATLRSFRATADADLINDEADSAVVRAGIKSEERDRLIEIELRRTGPRRAQVDKTALRRNADLLGVIRVISFLPDDLDLIKRGPGARRDLLDDVAVQLWPAARVDHTELERALRQRNAFLKTGSRDESTLAVWDARLSQAAGKVMARRTAVMSAMAPVLVETYQAVAGSSTQVGITYRPSWAAELPPTLSAAGYGDLISASLEKARRADYERRMSTVGTHRDEPGFVIAGQDARSHGSQGEARTMALAIKLAAHRVVAEMVGDLPVLLLDDVFSELDPVRAAALARSLPRGAQTLITSARPEDVPVGGVSWTVEDGVRPR
jgi:DNA replication and repair protein RecF